MNNSLTIQTALDEFITFGRVDMLLDETTQLLITDEYKFRNPTQFVLDLQASLLFPSYIVPGMTLNKLVLAKVTKRVYADFTTFQLWGKDESEIIDKLISLIESGVTYHVTINTGLAVSMTKD